ncbi:hypothetical protein [Flavobacterium reichenbachii]|uniref:Uncharacterized protein n=1 Tax=Flavobacterium reichenbachii TaxID=362418 RepID=A0A085ZMF2_9FLAO|nr:hypothetical protein [Flavobacterium reichenbachii]KFF05616.1 hypothetical protein IW19_08840 [Flavobacterium reichenbachii]OXB17949.1 hypothetical protein B0A68_03160 [Flavobacterium reichenbachii]
MIKNWKKKNENGISISIDIYQPHLFYFDKVDKNTSSDFLKGTKFGIAWEYNGNEINIFDKNGTVEGFPTANLEYVIAIFKNSILYPNPNNAVIFNLDGSFKKVIRIPNFKSEIILQEIKRGKKSNPPLDNDELYFSKYSRHIDKEGIEIDILDINYSLEYSESQILDSETLELTDFLKSRFDRNYYWNDNYKP